MITRAPAPTHSDMALLVDEVSRLRGRVMAVFARGSDCPLSAIEMTTLTATFEAKSPPTVAQIGRSLGHPRQVIQRAANSLAAAGLIRLEDNPAHKRAALLLCTDAGAAIKQADKARNEAIMAALMRDVDGPAVAQAVDLLRTIRRQIETHIKDRPA
jgi:DNA-binding MarR family transcriptional regulator